VVPVLYTYLDAWSERRRARRARRAEAERARSQAAQAVPPPHLPAQGD